MFRASQQFYTNNTFNEVTDRKSLQIGKPVYFSISPTIKIFGIYYHMLKCSFGTETRNFEFLRPNGCLYQPLNTGQSILNFFYIFITSRKKFPEILGFFQKCFNNFVNFPNLQFFFEFRV